MTDLSTRWLGLDLVSPLVVAACPLGNDVRGLLEAEAAGAGAVVMPSLFEEQIIAEQMAAHHFFDATIDRDAEARSFLPETDVFALGAEPYLRQLASLRASLSIPVLASLNGATPGGWTDYAGQLERAGASAIELNLYDVATDPGLSGADIEARQLEVVASVVARVAIPVTVKLGPFYASLPGFVSALAGVGVKGVTLFNRFYQPDIDLDQLGLDRHLQLSTEAELPLRLHALAILSPHALLDLACSGGVHDGRGAAKALLAGSDVVQLASVLLARGAGHVGVIRRQLADWLDGMGYASANEARGVLSLHSAPDPYQWERLNYLQTLKGWQPREGREWP
jgi:dihydroorotate dehydrogenase (fumarate)